MDTTAGGWESEITPTVAGSATTGPITPHARTASRCPFASGGGPSACPDAPSPDCQAGSVSFTYDSIDDFANVEEVATILDDLFHGHMHGAVGAADGNLYVQDVTNPSCSPRDPMF